jgi:uncharacterized protein YjbI with pentapeptide repeats
MPGYYFDMRFTAESFRRDALDLSEFERCIFAGCDFSKVNLIGAAFIDCTFEDCRFSGAGINHVSLRTAHFIGCDLREVNFAMCDRVIFEVGFRDCRLDFAKFYALNLARTQFSGCSLVAADFMKTDLREALFSGCDLRRAVFLQSDLTKADFRGSVNYSIDPEKCKLAKARFSPAESVGLLEKHNVCWV